MTSTASEAAPQPPSANEESAPIGHKRVSVAWPAFIDALAASLSVLEEDQFLVLSVKGTGVETTLDGDTGAPYFVQFAAQGAFGLRAEAVSNNFLVGSERLGPDAQQRLAELGWSPPTGGPDTTPERDPEGSPNYFHQWEQPVPWAVVAEVAATTLREVYRAPHPGFLTYTAFDADGNTILLPQLRLKHQPTDAVDIARASAPEVLSPTSPEELRDAIERTLREELGIDHIVVDDDGDIPLRWGSITVYVRAHPDAPIVRIFSFVLADVTPSPQLLEAINDINRSHLMLRAFYGDATVVLSADLLASPFVPEHFVTTLRTLADVADELDDELQGRFGGHVAPPRGTSDDRTDQRSPAMTKPITVLDAGITFADDGTAYPTVVLDVADRPDVADLARVHAIEGMGDLTTTLAVAHPGVWLTVSLTTPVRASFTIAFSLPEHLEVLEHAALTGNLLLATTTPSPEGTNPPWLAIDLDGPRLAALLARLEGGGDE